MVYRQKDSLPLQTSLPSPPPPSSPAASTGGGGSRISPAVLFIIVILAVIFFVSGLLHLLVRFLIKKNPSNSPTSPQSHHHHNAGDNSDSDALQRQLQQLFHLHDSGLDQAFIDALPVFLYREIIGSKEPFDCAVCLCEFSRDDQLRLLPLCGHAFHLDCIDTWLLSNSTCPLCRGALFVQGDAIENPMFDFEEDAMPEEGEAEEEVGGSEKRVVPVRLGKFRSTGGNGNNTNDGGGGGGGACAAGTDDTNGGGRIARREEGESSSSNLDARRCYSMGSYQYIVGDANLRVALSTNCDKNGRRGGGGGGGREKELRSGNLAVVDEDGKRLGAARKGESFSVSKIWQWGNKKGKFPDVSDASSLDGGLPWMNARRSVGDV